MIYTHSYPVNMSSQLYWQLICICCVALLECTAAQQDVRKFPPGFLFGSATSAYQVEGAWNEDGKAENIWDRLVHTNPGAINGSTNPDVGADSYHQPERDVEMLRELGMHFYRFSLSWSRLLPDHFSRHVNPLALQYYNTLIDEMLKYNIQPMVTLYHWDLPQQLQELGGWANPDIVNWFGDYARTVFQLFGDRVQYWITINEPRQICTEGYGTDRRPPQLNHTGVGDYICAKNLLLSHANAYQIYDAEFRHTQAGMVGISIHGNWFEPESDSEDDIAAAEAQYQGQFGLYAHPIYSSSGDFPPIMKERIAASSEAQGYRRSRLPEFSPEEIEFVRGSADFLGLNHYTSFIVYRNESVAGSHIVPSLDDDMGGATYQLEEWIQENASTMMRFVPQGLHKILNQIREEFNNPPVLITENGMSTPAGLEDRARVTYIRHYLAAILDAVEEGSDVRAYAAWSLMDNFEWLRGYTERFGLYEVDFSDPRRTRTPRLSAFVYKEIIRSGQIDFSYEPASTVMTIDDH